MGLIRGLSNLVNLSFRHIAVQSYNLMPAHIRTGSIAKVKNKLRKWVFQNVPIDWG